MSARVAIAIDGPAASGKSSTAKAVARELGYRHVDSGALYRAATAARLRRDTESATWTEESVLDAARIVTMSPVENGFVPLLNGRPADDEMRGDAVTHRVSLVAKMPRVREWVNAQVRNAARDYDVVVDGRDIGTVVFPKAKIKIFLVADAEERARRRVLERTGREPTEEEIFDETARILLRDELDATQSVKAADAVTIDTTRLTQQEQIAKIVELARNQD
ncbi:MAG TPA: (d)CMP kinase [Gemmatimonadaceae bacterium]|nr:(d)CMP kinase [Gemmatimonadaceae bacterium]